MGKETLIGKISLKKIDTYSKAGSIEELIDFLKSNLSFTKIGNPEYYIKHNATRFIYNLPTEHQKYVLNRYYIDKQTIYDIATELGNTPQHIENTLINGNSNLIDIVRLSMIFM